MSAPEPASPPRWLARLILGAVLVALAAAGIAVASFALWLALTLLPVVLIAGAIAYGAFRFQLWRARKQAAAGGPVWRASPPR